MLAVIGQLLPIALAVAISSVPIMATVLILLSPRRTGSAIPFLIGWVIGIALVTALCTLAAQAVPASHAARRPDTAVGVAEIVVGAALVGIAVVAWRRRGRRQSSELPKWLDTVGGLKAWAAFGLALVLNLRPKGLLLAIAAGLVLRAGDLPLGQSAVVIVIYTAIGASTVAVPVIASIVDAEHTEPRLRRTRDWLGQNSSVLTSVMLLVIGVVTIGTGLSRL